VALQSVQSGYSRIPPVSTIRPACWARRGWQLLARALAAAARSTAAAALLVFVDVMKELPATMVLRPFNTDTLAVVAYQLARDERLGEAALPSLALVLVGLIPVVLLSRTLRSRSSAACATARRTSASCWREINTTQPNMSQHLNTPVPGRRAGQAARGRADLLPHHQRARGQPVPRRLHPDRDGRRARVCVPWSSTSTSRATPPVTCWVKGPLKTSPTWPVFSSTP
jgi:hypothetical protein